MGFLDPLKKALQDYELKRIAASRAKTAPSSNAVLPMQSKPVYQSRPVVASSRPVMQSKPVYQSTSNYSSKPITTSLPLQSKPTAISSKPVYQSRMPIKPITPTKSGVTSMLLEPAKAYFTKQLRTPEQQQGVINRMKYDTQGLPEDIRTPVNTIRSALVNRLFAPMAQVPYYAKQAKESAKTIPQSKSIKEAGGNILRTGIYGLQTAAGLLPGVDDIAIAGYDMGKAKLAGRSVRKALAGEEYTGLGDVAAKVTKKESLANIGNAAELGAMVLAPGIISRKKIGNVDVPEFKQPYKRGDISAIEKQLDNLVDTDAFNISGKWNAKLPARQTAIAQLEHYANQGDEQAKQSLAVARYLEDQLANAQIGKTNPKPAEIVKRTGSVLDGVESDIPYERAREAHYWNSFDPDKRGKQEVEGYIETLKSDYNELKKLVKDEASQAKLDEMFEKYREGYKQRELKRMSADSRTASVMVSGPSNFPTARNQKRLNAARAAMDEAISYREFMKDKIKKTLNPTNYAISSDDPAAVKLLTEKMEKLKTSHATMLQANKIIRSGKNVEARLVSELGFKPETAKQLMQKDFAGRIGFPDYQLISNNRKIKEAQKRIEQLKKSEAQPGGEYKIDGGKIILNKENNRLQVTFDSIPDEQMRQKLKSNGYRWSPSQQAWQRQLTDNAKYNAKRLFGDFEKQESPKPQSTLHDINPKQFKTADEFVDFEYKKSGPDVVNDNNAIFYRGTHAEGKRANGFFASNASYATDYMGQGKGKIIAAKVEIKKPYYADADELEYINQNKDIIEKLKKQGFDGIIERNTPTTEVNGVGDEWQRLPFYENQVKPLFTIEGERSQVHVVDLKNKLKELYSQSGSHVAQAPVYDIPNEIPMKTSGRGTPFTVYKNPTHEQYLAIEKKFKIDHPTARGEAEIRMTYDKNGNTYAWDSYISTHDDVEKALKDKFGVIANQNTNQLPSTQVSTPPQPPVKNPMLTQAPVSDIAAPKKAYQESLTKYYKPATNLSKEDAVIQDKFYKQLFDNPDQAIKDYQKQFGNVLNTDNVRELSGDYQASRSLKSAAVHEPASAFTKMMYDQLISQDVPGKRKMVLFTAGGTGAGKSTAIDGLPDLSTIKQASKIVYDTNMNTFGSAVDKIDQAIKAGHEIVIGYVHSDPIKAFEQAIGRAKRMGRTVPLPEHIKTHIGAYDTIYKLKEMYKDNPNVKFRVVYNTGDKGKQFETTLESINGITYNKKSLEDDLNGLLNEKYQTKAISPEIYQGFSGRTVDNAAGQPSRLDGVRNGPKPQAKLNQKPVATQVEEKPMQSVGQILAERKLPKEVQESQAIVEKSINTIKGSGDAIGPIGAKQPGKYAFNINVDKLDLSDSEKKTLRESIDRIKPLLEKSKGKTLSNDEVIEAAKSSEILSKVTTREETLQANAAMLAARQRMNQLDKNITKAQESGNVEEITKNLQDFVESIKIVSAEAADRGRKLQSLSITAGDESLRAKLIKEFVKVEEDTAKIVAEVAKTDLNDANQVTNLYRTFIKPKTINILDEYRYNNMLSNPRTQIRNAYSNIFQTLVTRPATIAATGDIKGAGKYYQGVIENIGNATQAFKDAFNGKAAIQQQDLKYIPTKKLPKFLTIPSRALEGIDQFFTTLISGGEIARGTGKEKAKEIAAYSLFRQDLNPKGQGKLLNQIDKVTEAVYGAGEKIPALRWFVPFVRTPMNFAKQWIEYGPTGFATMVGSANKREQLAKSMLGSGVALMGAMAAMNGRTTWAAPVDQKEKELFYASGKKPFSIKVGDKWISMMYAGPFAMALALPAAINYYQNENRTALSEGQLDKIKNITLSMAEFLSGQTFMEGLGNFVSLAKGDVDYSLGKNIGYTAGQMVPMQGLVRYITTMIDPVYRKAGGAIEQFKSGIPLLSNSLTPYTDPEGNLSKREPINLVAPYDVSSSKSGYDAKQQDRTQELQENAIINKAKKQDKDIERALMGGLDVTKYDKTRVAEVAKKMIDKKDKKERRAEFIKLYNKGVITKEVVEELKRINNLEKKGLSSEDRELMLIPENIRARRIKSRIDDLKKENRRQKFVQLYQAGVITPAIVEALRAMNKN